MSGVHVSSYERLHAVTSVCERLRARQVAFGRVWSRLVAFGRANFFLCPGTFGRVLSYLVISCRILSSFFVIFRHFSSFLVISRPKFFFRVWRETGGCGSGWAGRAAVCSAWFPRRARDGPNDMTLTLSWHTVAAGPGLRLLMFRTIVLQNQGSLQLLGIPGRFAEWGWVSDLL